jgi:hypothetical protein
MAKDYSGFVLGTKVIHDYKGEPAGALCLKGFAFYVEYCSFSLQNFDQASRLTFRQADAGAMPRLACYLVIGRGVGRPRQRSLRWRWAGKSRSWPERGRSDVLVLVREVLRVTAVHPASCGGWQRPCAPLAIKGCKRRHRCGILCLRRRWLFSRSCPGSGLFCGGAADPGVGRTERVR